MRRKFAFLSLALFLSANGLSNDLYQCTASSSTLSAPATTENGYQKNSPITLTLTRQIDTHIFVFCSCDPKFEFAITIPPLYPLQTHQHPPPPSNKYIYIYIYMTKGRGRRTYGGSTCLFRIFFFLFTTRMPSLGRRLKQLLRCGTCQQVDDAPESPTAALSTGWSYRTPSRSRLDVVAGQEGAEEDGSSQTTNGRLFISQQRRREEEVRKVFVLTAVEEKRHRNISLLLSSLKRRRDRRIVKAGQVAHGMACGRGGAGSLAWYTDVGKGAVSSEGGDIVWSCDGSPPPTLATLTGGPSPSTCAAVLPCASSRVMPTAMEGGKLKGSPAEREMADSNPNQKRGEGAKAEKGKGITATDLAAASDAFSVSRWDADAGNVDIGPGGEEGGPSIDSAGLRHVLSDALGYTGEIVMVLVLFVLFQTLALLVHMEAYYRRRRRGGPQGEDERKDPVCDYETHSTTLSSGW
eukprot:gene7748-5433_t